MSLTVTRHGSDGGLSSYDHFQIKTLHTNMLRFTAVQIWG